MGSTTGYYNTFVNRKHRFLVRGIRISRVQAGALLLALASLFSAVSFWAHVPALGSIPVGKDPITLFEKRFDEIKAFLPPRGRVGYLSDALGETPSPSDPSLAYLYLTQYALSPLVVVNHSQERLVVGDFRDRESGMKIARQRGLKQVRDFGRGLLLFQKERP